MAVCVFQFSPSQPSDYYVILKGKSRKRYEFGVAVSIVATLEEGLVVDARSLPDYPYDGHMLNEALEQAEILAYAKPEKVVVDHGYRGADIVGVQVWMSGQQRGVTRSLKTKIKRRSAIEPAIGHMKADGKLGRNWLNGALDDALQGVLCGGGHNIRLILNKSKAGNAKTVAC